MNEEIDAPTGSESLSIDEAAAAYAKATATKEPEGQPDPQEPDESGTTDDELQTSEPDEGDEGDGEPDPDGEAGEDDEGAEPDSDQGRFVSSNGKHRMSDGTVLTVAELAAGYMKDGDYRQKTTERAREKEANAAESSVLKQREAQLNQQAEYLTGLIQAIVPQAPPDPSQLDTDPIGYMKAMRDYEQWGQHLQYLNAQQQQVYQARQAEAQQGAKETAEREWTTLVEKLPVLKDPAKAKAFGDKLLTAGKANGFSEDELRSLLPTDHRLALVLRKAAKWDDLQASKPKVQQKIENRPPVQKGGKRLNASENRARATSDAFTKLGQTGRLDDAVAAFLATQNK